MELDLIKKYVQSYLDTVLIPDTNKELVGDEDEPITMKVFEVLKGSYQPPIYHIFIDIEPNWNGSILLKLGKNISDFMRMISIDNPIKIHWNKRPKSKKP